MANPRPGDICYIFGGANPAAAASAAALWPMGLTDATDVAGYRAPAAGAIVGVVVNGAPASGDTVTVQPRVGSTDVTGLTAQITNSVTSAQDWGDAEDHSSQAVAEGDVIKCMYTTTTGGTYGGKDVVVQVWYRPNTY